MKSKVNTTERAMELHRKLRNKSDKKKIIEFMNILHVKNAIECTCGECLTKLEMKGHIKSQIDMVMSEGYRLEDIANFYVCQGMLDLEQYLKLIKIMRS